jgi:hypothetical protein
MSTHAEPSIPSQTPLAEHQLAVSHRPGTTSEVMASHRPVAQVSHAPSQALSQQVPSTQKPLVQSPAVSHRAPASPAHSPPIQVVPAPHNGSLAPDTASHCPPTSQAMHGPAHALSQQRPSAHWPELQAPSLSHAAPSASFASQKPAPLQK